MKGKTSTPTVFEKDGATRFEQLETAIQAFKIRQFEHDSSILRMTNPGRDPDSA